jgi:hypothetical protein
MQAVRKPYTIFIRKYGPTYSLILAFFNETLGRGSSV